MTVRLRKPTPVALAAVGVSFGPWSALAVGGAAYIGYAGWIMMTVSRAAREERIARRSAERAAREAAEAKSGQGDATRRPPVASKRYTPPASKRRSRR